MSRLNSPVSDRHEHPARSDDQYYHITTLGGTVIGDPVKEIIKVAFKNGISMFDTAEGYEKGQSEVEMGRVIKEIGYCRSDLVIITTKLFFGTRTDSSEWHWSLQKTESLGRLGLDYVDVFFTHPPDYTSILLDHIKMEWSASDIEEAYNVAKKLDLIPPITEQCQHHMFHCERPEKEYSFVYKRYCALASILLTGKFAAHTDFFKVTLESLDDGESLSKSRKVQTLSKLAETELGCSVVDNLKALDVISKLMPEILDKIETILQNTCILVTVVVVMLIVAALPAYLWQMPMVIHEPRDTG
ncbi:NADP-dependent oxidoreductase domain-containing protein [Suillus subluteus]|nr:NADP-dependent oxidoreductase domain-containing protein [Suillus subluteus]